MDKGFSRTDPLRPAGRNTQAPLSGRSETFDGAYRIMADFDQAGELDRGIPGEGQADDARGELSLAKVPAVEDNERSQRIISALSGRGRE